MDVSAADEVTVCPLAEGAHEAPLAVSGSRRIAGVITGFRRMCLYDLEEQG